MKVASTALRTAIVSMVMVSIIDVVPRVAAAATLCDFGELPFQLGDIVEPAFKCQSASGYSFVQPSTLPTTAQLETICAKCASLLGAVTLAKDELPTCALAMDNGSTVTVDKLFVGITTQCTRDAATPGTGSSPADGSDAGTAPSAGIIPTTAPSENPATTTATPAPQKAKKTATTTAGPSASSTSDVSSGSDAEEEEDDEEPRAASEEGSTDDELLPVTNSSTPQTTRSTSRPSATTTASSSAVAAVGAMAPPSMMLVVTAAAVAVTIVVM